MNRARAHRIALAAACCLASPLFGCGSNAESGTGPVSPAQTADAAAGVALDAAVGPSDDADLDANEPVPDASRDAQPQHDSGLACDASQLSDDPNNCGACGTVCTANGPNDTPACVASACRVITTLATMANASYLTLAGSTLVWATLGTSSTVASLPLNPMATAPTILATSQEYIAGLSSTSRYVFWDINPTAQSGLTEYDLLTNTRITAVPNVYAAAIISDGSFVYWIDPTGSTLSRAAVDGTGSTILYTFTSDILSSVLAQDSSYLYLSNGRNVQRILKSGGAPTSLGTALADSSVYGLGVDGADVYWTGGAGGKTILANAKDGSGTTSTIVTAQGPIFGLVVDTEALYFSDGMTLVRSAKTSGTAEVPLAPPTTQGVGGIAVDDTYVYWSDSAAGTILRTTK